MTYCCFVDSTDNVLLCCVCVCLYAIASHYAAILFPHSPGAVRDLARSAELGNIVAHFMEENSKLQ